MGSESEKCLEMNKPPNKKAQTTKSEFEPRSLGGGVLKSMLTLNEAIIDVKEG